MSVADRHPADGRVAPTADHDAGKADDGRDGDETPAGSTLLASTMPVSTASVAGATAVGAHTTGSGAVSDRSVDPRAVRVALAPALAHAGLEPMIVEPLPVPVAPIPSVIGVGILGGHATPAPTPATDRMAAPAPPAPVVIDGVVTDATLTRLDRSRAILRAGPVSGEGDDDGAPPASIRVILEPPEQASDGRGATRREVVVDGWRVELDLESERRAALRDRARRGREESARGGPTEVHAIIPGRIVSVSVAPGDEVVASQQLLVVEAMKMQNELRAPRDGTVSKVAVAPGDTIEIGDLLLVLE